MVTREELAIARKAVNEMIKGNVHYVYLLDEFLDKISKHLAEQDNKIPAILRSLPSESA